MKDEILPTKMQNGDYTAFDNIFRKHWRAVYCFVKQNITSEEDAQELTQDIFVKLWQNSRKTVVVSLQNYLYSIARGTVIDYIRRKVNNAVFERLSNDHDLLADTPDHSEEKEKMLNLLQRYAADLPDRQREVYQLRWHDGLSRKDIADRMGITVTTVDIHLRKAIETLRKKFVVRSPL
ncbi:MAG: sigma-70 family RNA polymerase sigma factor [Tannerella sp.]|jgi:RNA polymerase sigma-70 factor (ECF subfamily)|nr:sigma-70 family RNA polymerase sigma factor [Tannerella sp.]